MRQAARIAINRTIAGVHYPVDSSAGQLLGLSLAEYFLARCGWGGSSAALEAWHFDGGAFEGQQDFAGTELFDAAQGTRLSTPYASRIESVLPSQSAPPVQPFSVAASPHLAWLWAQARLEWQSGAP
jgi:hypothetical protein